MQLVATPLTHPFRWIDAIGVDNPLDAILIPHRDNPPLDILFASGRGDWRAGEIDPYPLTLDSFKWGAFVPGFTPRGDYIVSNWDGAAFAVTKTGGSRFTDFATSNASKTATSATAAFTQDDIGQVIAATGVPAGATIESVEGPTSITLSIAATASNVGLTVLMANRAATYSIAPDFGSVELNDLFIDGVVHVVADQAARYALPTNTVANTIYRQESDQTYWKVVTPASIGSGVGWSDDVAELAEVTLAVEMEIVVSGKRFTTQAVTLTIANDYITGGEDLPTAANPSTAFRWRPDLTGFTGGAAKLDGVDISTFGVGTVIAMLDPSTGVACEWLLTAPIAITSSSAANPSTVTAPTHGLPAGDTAIVGGGHTLASINASLTATYVGPNTFTVPVLGGGTGGYFGPAENAGTGIVQPDTAWLGRYWRRIS